MRNTITGACLLVVVAVSLSAAQTPTPQPAVKNQANIDALKKKLDEKQDQIKRKTEDRDDAEIRLSSPAERPAPRDDDHLELRPGLEGAQDLFGHLFRCFGSPIHCAWNIYDDTPRSAPHILQGNLQYLEAKEKELEQLTLEYDKIRAEFVAAGGELPSGILRFSLESQASPLSDEQKRMEEEYRAEELKRKEEAKNKTKNEPPPSPPPPPISSIAHPPRWDVAASFGVGSSLPASYHLVLPLNEVATVTGFTNATVDLGSQGQDATGLSDVIFNGPPEFFDIRRPGFDKEPGEFDTGRAVGNVVAMLRRPRWVSVAPPAQPSAPVALRPSVKVFFVSLGRSTGEAVRMTVVNDGNVPVRIATDGFALVPLANVSVRDVERELAKLAGSPQVTINLNAYCRDLKKPPPAAGTVMGLAEPAVQSQLGPVQRMFAASRKLMDEGALKPDVDDPEMYFHSIRQWSRWALAEKFTERTFTAAFVEHTKKNVAAAGQRWQSGYDKEVRELAASRWRDVQLVLAATNVR